MDELHKAAVKLEGEMQDSADETIILTNKKIEETFAAVCAVLEWLKISPSSPSLLTLKETEKAKEKMLSIVPQLKDKDNKQRMLKLLNKKEYAYQARRKTVADDLSEAYLLLLHDFEIDHHIRRLKNVVERSYYHQMFEIQKSMGFAFVVDKVISDEVMRVVDSTWRYGNFRLSAQNNHKEIVSYVHNAIDVAMKSERPIEDTKTTLQLFFENKKKDVQTITCEQK